MCGSFHPESGGEDYEELWNKIQELFRRTAIRIQAELQRQNTVHGLVIAEGKRQIEAAQRRMSAQEASHQQHIRVAFSDNSANTA